MTAPYVLLPKAAADTGYTVKALERKIERGELVEGIHWRKAPDGRRLIVVAAFVAWMEGRQTCKA